MGSELYEYLKSDFELILSTYDESLLGKINGSSFFITGAAGLVGKYLSYFLIYLVEEKSFDIKLVLSSFSESELLRAFGFSKANIRFVPGDITKGLAFDGKVDYVIHLASNANPALYLHKPINTELGIIVGTNNILSLALYSNAKRVFCASTTDVYGTPLKSGPLSESDIGTFDCNNVRGVCNESKRAAESLCQAWIVEKGLDVLIGRFSRLFGPTANFNSSLASISFFKKAALGERIDILKPTTAKYSFTYVGDAVMAILLLLFRGSKGEAYNIADDTVSITIDELAEMIIAIAGTHCEIVLGSDLVSEKTSSFHQKS